MTFAVVAILGHFSKTLLLFFIPQVFIFLVIFTHNSNNISDIYYLIFFFSDYKLSVQRSTIVSPGALSATSPAKVHQGAEPTLA
jgi:hypothetical protein